jgi:predicted dehydrogenase
MGGAAAAWALGSLPGLAEETAPDKVVIGVMGLSRGSSLAVSFAEQPGVEVKYLCDTDAGRAQAVAQMFTTKVKNAQTPELVADFRKILDDPSVHALICAAPNHWHAPATILACSAGKHVYVEKPCCHNPREGEWMVAAARKYNRAVQMGSQRRSSPGTRAAMRKLHDGVIGHVYLARSWYTSARGSIGKGQPAPVPPQLDYDLWQGPAPRRPYLDNRIPYNWHWFWHWGNGELGNNGVHTIDLCRFGLQADFPVRVTSSGGRYHFDDDQETPDTHTVCLEFEGKRQIVWEGRSCNKHDSDFIVFYGDQGTLELDGDGTFRVFDAQDKKVEEVPSPSQGDEEHIADFLRAIRRGEPLALNAEIAEGYKSTLLCHLGNIAHRTGRTLNCHPADGHIAGDHEAMQFWGREYEAGWEPQV